jgi:hypothetical protein
MRLIRSLFGRAGSRALAVLLASIVSFGVVHTTWDDLACDPLPVHHDHSAHRFKSGTLPIGAQDHCLFCHSLRSLRHGLVATQTPVVDTTQAAAVRSASLVLPGRLLDPNAPSRAPPSILL